MAIPKSKNNLLIKDWIKFEQLNTAQYEFDVDREIALLNHYTGITITEFNIMSFNELSAWQKKLRKFTNQKLNTKPKRIIKVNGIRYRACKDERDFRANQWTALKHYEQDQLSNTHKILALIYQETKLFKPYKFVDVNCTFIADNLLNNGKVGDVYGTLFFYLQRFEGLRLISQASFLIAQEEIKEHLNQVYQELQKLGINTDGSLSSMTSQVESLVKNSS